MPSRLGRLVLLLATAGLAGCSRSALGFAQLTLGADEHLLRMARAERRWNWMLGEVERWPRHPGVHGPGFSPGRVKRLVEKGEIGPHNEYLFDPARSTRGAVLWLMTLVDRWTTDELPDGYGSFARGRLNQGKALSEQQLLDLVTASYNGGYSYVRDLVEEHGTAWTEHTNDEVADYLERVRRFTVLYQQAPAPEQRTTLRPGNRSEGRSPARAE